MKEKVKNIHEAIRIEAYLLSEKSGHPAGMESHFWSRAEAIVHARVAGATKAAGVKKKVLTKAKTPPKPTVKAAPQSAAKPRTVAKGKATPRPPVNDVTGKKTVTPARSRATKK